MPPSPGSYCRTKVTLFADINRQTGRALVASPAHQSHRSLIRMSAPTQSEPQPSTSYLDMLTVSLRPSVLVIMLLGFSSGLPLALSGETLRVWMAGRGVPPGAIGP